MKQTLAIATSVSLAFALSNCAPQNNMQADAATGAAVGGVLGAIVGNNVGDGDAGRGALLGAALGGAAGAAHGHNKDQGGTGLIPQAQPQQQGYYNQNQSGYYSY
ncbi:MAG: glycine zipper domain-containing protein [Verrucomicrobiota bacterium JB023]|nr:glycine zipper domain-containing protein [Verrucomicrobiota bacterium JB023]